MKSRAITLGASVIALTLAGAGSAQAGALDGIGPQLPDPGIAAKVEANVKANIKTNAKTPVAAPSRGSVEADAHGSDHPHATVEAKHGLGPDQSHVVLNWDSRHGASAYADQRRRGKIEIEAEGHAGARHAQSTVSAFSSRAGEATAKGRVDRARPKRSRAERAIRDHSRRLATTKVPGASGQGKRLTPLQAIGRQVGNPLQLGLAGWLIGLTGAGLLGVPRLVRRLGRTR